MVAYAVGTGPKLKPLLAQVAAQLAARAEECSPRELANAVHGFGKAWCDGKEVQRFLGVAPRPCTARAEPVLQRKTGWGCSSWGRCHCVYGGMHTAPTTTHSSESGQHTWPARQLPCAPGPVHAVPGCTGVKHRLASLRTARQPCAH